MTDSQKPKDHNRTIAAQVKVLAHAKSLDGLLKSLEWYICDQLGYRRSIMVELRYEIGRIRKMKASKRSENIALAWMADLFGASMVSGKWGDYDNEAIAAAVWASIAAQRIGKWQCLKIGGGGLIDSWYVEILRPLGRFD